MRTLRAYLLSGIVGFCIAGCGSKQPSAPAAAGTNAVPAGATPAAAVAAAPPQAPAVTQAQVAAVSKADLDPRQLPPVRPPLAAAPDLYAAVYAINASTLGTMTRNGVPGDVVAAMHKLNGKTYSTTQEFAGAAVEVAGSGPFQAYKDAILRCALIVTLADPPAGPRGQASIDEAIARGQAHPDSTGQK